MLRDVARLSSLTCPFCRGRTIEVSRWTRSHDDATVTVCISLDCKGHYGWRYVARDGRQVPTPGDPAILGGPHDNPAVTRPEAADA